MATKQDNLWGSWGRVSYSEYSRVSSLFMLSLMSYFCSHGKEEGKKEGEEKERTLAKVLNDIQKRLHGARAAYWSS